MVVRLQGARPAGPPPSRRPSRCASQRLAWSTGAVLVAGQRIFIGRVHRHETVSIDVTDTTLTVHFDSGASKVFARTNDHPVR